MMGKDRDLSGVKAGDMVAITSYGGWHGACIAKGEVARVTATQVVTTDGRKWRRKDGDKIGGDGWNSTDLRVWSATVEAEYREQCAEVARRKLANKIEDTRWRDLPLDVLEAVAAALKNLEVSPTPPAQTGVVK